MIVLRAKWQTERASIGQVVNMMRFAPPGSTNALASAASTAVASVLVRDRGLVFTGPTGMGKTALAMFCVEAFSVRHFVGGIRSVEDAHHSVELAQRHLVVGVFRSGDSVSVRSARLPDMSISDVTR